MKSSTYISGMNLEELRKKASEPKSGGFLCVFEPDDCVWNYLTYCHTSYLASKTAGMGTSQAVNFYTSRTKGCVGRFALLGHKQWSHIVPGQKLVYTFTDAEGKELRFWGLARACEALGVDERTIRRWTAAGKCKRFPIVLAVRTAPKRAGQATKDARKKWAQTAKPNWRTLKRKDDLPEN